ncbi:hypothetical protein ABZS66_38665 [Dactylosporangium sp. NPDC005572]|uniref:hypothetical protein n=1 Tax=Dactylosporangium sp. NPDC005572 TaxID=3156889 RepID=UPI0033AF2E51
MVDDPARPSRLSGLWAFAVGGLLLVVLLVILHPATSQKDCSNYGANGNASAFSNPNGNASAFSKLDWDIYLPLVTVGWLVLVIMEQVLPVTWRNRGRVDGAVRATAAIGLSTVGLCCFVLPLEVVCR